MKFKHAIAIGALGCISFAAIAQQQQSPFITAAPATPATAGGPIVLNLSGVTVTDAAGQPVGPIQHILLSPAGCVDMAVLSLGGQRMVAVPWTLVGGTGAARAETDIATRAALALKLDRAVLQQAPAITVAQLAQPQALEQSRSYFVQFEQQPGTAGTAAGGTTSQAGVNVGVGAGATATNRIGVGLTNAGVGSFTNATGSTNQTGILSPTGPTNAAPGRPAFETNRPAQPSIIPPGRPDNRPPANRPPTNTPGPGAGAPGGATPNSPGL